MVQLVGTWMFVKAYVLEFSLWQKEKNRKEKKLGIKPQILKTKIMRDNVMKVGGYEIHDELFGYMPHSGVPNFLRMGQRIRILYKAKPDQFI